MSLEVSEALSRLGLVYVPLLFALCFHEMAHGWMAKRKGDNTAELMGRMTMNPFAHMDLLGTVILPIVAILGGWFLFGWAKPVPVNERNLDKPKEDMFWIALAGPLSNVLLALVGAFLWFMASRFMGVSSTTAAVVRILDFFILINLVLALFNMLPLHPLDGGKVMARFLPVQANMWLEKNQQILMYALIFIFIVGGFRYLAQPIYWLHAAIKLVVATVFGSFI